MRLIKDSKATVIVFNLLEKIDGTHPWQLYVSLLYVSRCRGVTDCLCIGLPLRDIVLPLILRQATNGPDRRLDRLIVRVLLTQSAVASYVKKNSRLNQRSLLSLIEHRFCADIDERVHVTLLEA